MFMTASRVKMEGEPVLKLNIHEYGEDDIAFLDSLGIDKTEDDSAWRYTYIYSREDFLKTRAAIFERYECEEKGIKVFLEKKEK
ncbi:MAG: hypothetical protein ACI8PB_001202 [Desulforhopalus sp.]|jgi:hypothetical protein